MTTTAKQTSQFFQQWTIYRSVIEHNYMHHDEIGQQLDALLENVSKKVSILDLGCGDAEIIARTKHPDKIRSYTGVDLSEMALEFAREKLAKHPFETIFVLEDYASFLKASRENYDIILVGFTLHHLNSAAKTLFFQYAKQALSANSDSRLIIYDVVRRSDETQYQFIARMCQYFQKHWQVFSSSQLDSILDHVKNNDQPEDRLFFESVAATHGFQHFHSHFTDQEHFYSLMSFR